MQLNNDYVQFEKIKGFKGDIGLITLNRQRSLNALDHGMFIALKKHLSEWGQDPLIKAVVICAVPGRAFSSGGDIRSIYEKKMAGDVHFKKLFDDEYQVNRDIFHYNKPYIALLNGTTMGGGAGISLHGSHRLATDRLHFAMPETGIGFFPDIGASYFLSRLPHRFGFYLGLTGNQIAYNDCFALHLVDFVIKEEAQNDIITALAESLISDKKSVTDIVKQYAISVPPSLLLSHREEVEVCFAKASVEEIIKALEQQDTQWCQETAAIIKTRSPLSLKVTLEQLRKATHLNFDACMDMEHRLMEHFIKAHDLFEGIRAALIDKDRQPKWQPAALEEVSESMVKAYFE